MDLSPYFKSIIDQDLCAVVICNLEHEIIYMNPAAVGRYAKRGGAELVYMIALRDEAGTLIGYYEKHEYRDRETEEFYHFA